MPETVEVAKKSRLLLESPDITNVRAGLSLLGELARTEAQLCAALGYPDDTCGFTPLCEALAWAPHRAQIALWILGTLAGQEVGWAREISRIDCHDMGLVELPDVIGQLVGLHTLILGRNKLSELPEALRSLTRLEVLRLEGNGISVLPDWLGTLPRLREITLPHGFQQLPPELPYLYLDSSDWERWSPQILQMKTLRHLHLGLSSPWEVEHLPAALGGLSGLEVLEITEAPLTEVPDTICELEQLVYLRLWQVGYRSTRRFTALPEDIGRLRHLQVLELAETELQALPDTIGQLRALRGLCLMDHKLTSLPASFCGLESLERLDLWGNPITALPAGFGRLSRLQELKLGRTPLTHLPDSFRDLTQLRSLDLKDAKLETVPDFVHALPSLVSLVTPDGTQHAPLAERLRAYHADHQKLYQDPAFLAAGFVAAEAADGMQAWCCGPAIPTRFIEHLSAQGYHITRFKHGSFAGEPGPRSAWFVVMSRAPGFAEQCHRVGSRAEISAFIETQTAAGYWITALDEGPASQWLVVMTRGPRWTEQRWQVSTDFPGDFIAAASAEGLRVTSLSHGRDAWVTVVSRSPGKRWRQTWARRSTGAGLVDWVMGGWTDNRSISSLAWGAKTWGIVMTRFPLDDLSTLNHSYAEHVSLDDARDWCVEQWAEKQRLVEVAPTGAGWLLVVGTDPEIL